MDEEEDPTMDEESDIPELDGQDVQELGPGVALDEGAPVGSRQVPAPIILQGPQGPQPATAPFASPPSANNPFSPQALANNMFWARQQYQLANTPIAEAEKSVTGALRFQAIRQYQNDIANGVNPSEALARSAPLMFLGPKQSSLGQAGAFIKNTTQSPFVHYKGSIWSRNRDGSFTKVMEGPAEEVTVGNVRYRKDANGKMIPITPPLNTLSPVDKAFLGADVAQLKTVEKEAQDAPGFGLFHPFGGKKAELEKKAEDLRQQIRKQYGSQSTPAIGGSAPTVTTKEQFDRLPSGTVYTRENGKRYRKP